MNIAIDTISLRGHLFHTNTSKLVWFCLMRDVGEDSLVRTSASGIAKEIGVNEKTVRNVLKSFADNGIIDVISPIQSPILSPNKVRYMGCAIKLNDIEICKDSKKTKVRKKSDMHSDIKSDIPTAEITTENAVAIPEELYPSWVEDSFREVWKEWLRYRKEMHKEYKSDASAKVGYERLKNMSGGNPEVAMAIIEQSIGNGYQGIFPVKNNQNDNGTNNPANQSSGRGQHRNPGTLDIAAAILKRTST